MPGGGDSGRFEIVGVGDSRRFEIVGVGDSGDLR